MHARKGLYRAQDKAEGFRAQCSKHRAQEVAPAARG